MRRWQLLNRFRRVPDTRDRGRCVLVVEQLEQREVLSPTVFAPAITPTPDENTAFTFAGSSSFFVDNYTFELDTHLAVLSAANGTVTIDTALATSLGLNPTGDGTPTVTLTGNLNDINAVLASGVTFTPADYYSGDAALALTVTDQDVPFDPPGTDSVVLQVQPVASSAFLTSPTFGEVDAPSSGLVFGPGLISVQNWPDADTSETATVIFQLYVDDPTGFTLSAGGVPITPDEPGQWSVTAHSAAELQAVFDSLVLTPPAGFTGPAGFSTFGSISDHADYGAAPGVTTPSQFIGEVDLYLRFFVGGSVTAPTAFGLEGGTIDLGGRYAASDPDVLPGDTHTLALSVPSGALAFDPGAVPPGLSVSATAGADGSTTLVLDGDLGAINAFLAAPGSVTYTAASAFFSGIVPLSITLTNHPGVFMGGYSEGYGPMGQPGPASDAPNAFSGVAALAFVPVADHVFPSAVDVTTNVNTPVAVAIGVSPLADTDGSESVLLLVDGVPAGASFNHGTGLGGGQWALAPTDLPGLTFTPPPGATGAFALVVRAVVNDSAPGLGSDVAVESTTFTVTVVSTAGPPDAGGGPAGAFVTSIVAGAVIGAGDAGPNGPGARPDPASLNRAVFVNGYSSGSNTDVVGLVENRANYAPPTQGALFAQVEVPLPSYGDGERHPLPPVLPLDQTLPVAGFTESGGDNFALIDKLYRDAAGAPAVTRTGAILPEDTVTWAAADPAAPIRVAVAPEPADPEGAAGALPTEVVAGSGAWRFWVAGAAVAAGLASWAWPTRGPDGAPARAVFWLLRLLQRRTTRRAV